ncbi:MAG: type II restriction endonuclease [Thermoanaerobaculia bacterium]
MMTFDPDRPVESFKAILRELLRGYRFDVKGLYLTDGSIEPLPRESSVVGKVLEVSIKHHLARHLLSEKLSDLRCISASSDRTYPDFTFNGPLIHPHRFAVDIKCARRTAGGKKTRSAITIGTFDAEYFRYPQEKVANIMRPYGTYTAHLSVIALYDYADATARNVELLVVEKWRVATKKRASGTRCYIATKREIEALRLEQGDFESEADFHTFWRSQEISQRKQARWKAKRRGDGEDPVR